MEPGTLGPAEAQLAQAVTSSGPGDEKGAERVGKHQVSWLEKITGLIFRHQTEESDMTESLVLCGQHRLVRGTHRQLVDQAELRL